MFCNSVLILDKIKTELIKIFFFSSRAEQIRWRYSMFSSLAHSYLNCINNHWCPVKLFQISYNLLLLACSSYSIQYRLGFVYLLESALFKNAISKITISENLKALIQLATRIIIRISQSIYCSFINPLIGELCLLSARYFANKQCYTISML